MVRHNLLFLCTAKVGARNTDWERFIEIFFINSERFKVLLFLAIARENFIKKHHSLFIIHFRKETIRSSKNEEIDWYFLVLFLLIDCNKMLEDPERKSIRMMNNLSMFGKIGR